MTAVVTKSKWLPWVSDHHGGENLSQQAYKKMNKMKTQSMGLQYETAFSLEFPCMLHGPPKYLLRVTNMASWMIQGADDRRNCCCNVELNGQEKREYIMFLQTVWPGS